MLKLYCLPTIHGAIEISKNNPSRAILNLEAAAPYELGGTLAFPYLYPVWVRGQAYLAAHNGVAAAAEFQKLIDHPGIVPNQPIASLAHLELAGRMPYQATTSGRVLPIKISSRSGKMPTPTSPSSLELSWNTRSSNN
jgi:hypothetical protein